MYGAQQYSQHCGLGLPGLSKVKSAPPAIPSVSQQPSVFVGEIFTYATTTSTTTVNNNESSNIKCAPVHFGDWTLNISVEQCDEHDVASTEDLLRKLHRPTFVTEWFRYNDQDSCKDSCAHAITKSLQGRATDDVLANIIQCVTAVQFTYDHEYCFMVYCNKQCIEVRLFDVQSE